MLKMTNEILVQARMDTGAIHGVKNVLKLYLNMVK